MEHVSVPPTPYAPGRQEKNATSRVLLVYAKWGCTAGQSHTAHDARPTMTRGNVPQLAAPKLMSATRMPQPELPTQYDAATVAGVPMVHVPGVMDVHPLPV